MKAKMMKKPMGGTDAGSVLGQSRSGAFLLMVAFAAVFASGVLIYLKVSHFREGETIIQKPLPSAAEVRVREAIQAKLPVGKNSMYIPDTRALEGRWYSRFAQDLVAEITLGAGAFEIVFTQDPQGRLRKYSRGIYEYDSKVGVLTLKPLKQAGAPVQIKGVSYKVLTMRPFDFYVLKQPGSPDLHLIAPERDVPGKSFHPLFLYADYAGAPVLKFSPTEVK